MRVIELSRVGDCGKGTMPAGDAPQFELVAVTVPTPLMAEKENRFTIDFMSGFIKTQLEFAEVSSRKSQLPQFGKVA